MPVLRALGWDTEDLEDVKLEYKRKAADNPVDYALILLRQPRLFIEAKALGAQLGDHRWANQILAYASVAGVEWVVLTDGDEYRLYNSHAIVPVEQKLFRTLRISDPASRPADTLGLLSKGQLQDHLIDQYWKTEFVDRQVGDVLRGLFGPEPDSAVMRLVHGRVPALARSDVRSSLARLRPSFDFPVVVSRPSAVAPAFRVRPAGAASARPDLPPAPDQPARVTGEGTTWRGITLGQLIEAGLVGVPMTIGTRYRGSDLVARIEGPDRVVFDDVAHCRWHGAAVERWRAQRDGHTRRRMAGLSGGSGQRMDRTVCSTSCDGTCSSAGSSASTKVGAPANGPLAGTAAPAYRRHLHWADRDARKSASSASSGRRARVRCRLYASYRAVQESRTFARRRHRRLTSTSARTGGRGTAWRSRRSWSTSPPATRAPPARPTTRPRRSSATACSRPT